MAIRTIKKKHHAPNKLTKHEIGRRVEMVVTEMQKDCALSIRGAANKAAKRYGRSLGYFDHAVYKLFVPPIERGEATAADYGLQDWHYRIIDSKRRYLSRESVQSASKPAEPKPVDAQEPELPELARYIDRLVSHNKLLREELVTQHKELLEATDLLKAFEQDNVLLQQRVCDLEKELAEEKKQSFVSDEIVKRLRSELKLARDLEGYLGEIEETIEPSKPSDLGPAVNSLDDDIKDALTAGGYIHVRTTGGHHHFSSPTKGIVVVPSNVDSKGGFKKKVLTDIFKGMHREISNAAEVS